MKKSLYSIISMCVVTLVIICLVKYYTQDSKVLMDNHISKQSDSTSISMMYETDYQSGIYQETTGSLFPIDGYAFNSNLSKCENGSILNYDESTGKVMMYANKSDKCYVYFDVKPLFLSSYITDLYTTDGENGLYLHDADLENGAGDNSLRYAGANPDNYVCFGTDEETCSEDNLYRIIGVFGDSIKLIDADISADNVGVFGSLSTGSNWTNSYLKPHVDSMINEFAEKWQNMILDATWNSGSETVVNKAGILYANEYVYSSSMNWEYLGSINPVNNWLFLDNGKWEWTMSKNSDLVKLKNNSDYSVMFLAGEAAVFNCDESPDECVFYIDSSGKLYVKEYSTVNGTAYIRLTFYLVPTVKYLSGVGSADDPFRIE